jgi:hypothetical protein
VAQDIIGKAGRPGHCVFAAYGGNDDVDRREGEPLLYDTVSSAGYASKVLTKGVAK